MGVVGSHKGVAPCKLRTAEWHQLMLISAQKNTQNSYPTLPASCSHVVIYSQLQLATIPRSPKNWWTSNKPQKQATVKARSLGNCNFQHWYLPEMLCELCDDEKCVSLLCASQIFSNPDTNEIHFIPCDTAICHILSLVIGFNSVKLLYEFTYNNFY